MRPSETLKKYHWEIVEILQRYPMVINPRVVGSVARGEDTEESDIDFLVDTLPGTSLFDLGGLQDELQEFLGVHVDIILSGAHLHKYMQMTLERDAEAI